MELVIIQQKIYEVRNQKVMLDFDLAELYEIQTRVLKQSVKRNIDRFPKDFMFQLTREEWNELITNCDNLPQGIKLALLLLMLLQNMVLQCLQRYYAAKELCN